jgi:hypothetical protein
VKLSITNPAGQTVTYTATTAAGPAVTFDRPSHPDPDRPVLTLEAPSLLDLDRDFDLAGLPGNAIEVLYPELVPHESRWREVPCSGCGRTLATAVADPTAVVLCTSCHPGPLPTTPEGA